MGQKEILITGGLGFLGSNLAKELSLLNYKVTILDNLNPQYGGNLFNLFDAKKENIKIIYGDVRDFHTIESLVKNKDYIFHFAAQVSYIDSLGQPFDDLQVNTLSTLNILESIKKLNQKSKIIFSSSRMVYGKIKEIPVNELHPTNPISLYGVHKLTSEKYLELYSNNYGISFSILRITNPYGIKQQMKHSKYSMVGWFIRQSMEDKKIKIFGSGEQKRDYIYIKDIISALLLIAFNSKTANGIYNLGFGHSIMFKDMVNGILSVVKKGGIEFVDWPTNYENLETGDFEVSIEKLKSDTGWKPEISLLEGIEYTFNYYKKNKEYYFT